MIVEFAGRPFSDRRCSTFVGVACTVACLPIPGLLAKRMQRIYGVLAAKADARVQTVTEVLNVIRMIKLFGWEPRIAKQLNEKRQEELVAIRRNRMLGMLNNICK